MAAYNNSRMSITLVSADILTSKEQFIVQQNCCTAVRAHGLSSVIAGAFPGCDPYASRRQLKGNWAVAEDRPEPGSLLVLEREEGDPSIICAFAQYYHGKPFAYSGKDPLVLGVADGYADRFGYFKSCLGLIAELKPRSVAFPYKIGCGLAGGSWNLYEAELNAWSKRNPGIDVKIYRIG